jgi:hypothetical protein
MKKFKVLVLLGLTFSIVNFSNADCTREVTCGGPGSTLSCSGKSCTGSRPLDQNPWVECDGSRSYCYPQVP